MMLAALVARADRWFAFNRQWAKLLAKEQIEFSHIIAMENKRPPFQDWGLQRTRPFVGRAAPLMKKYCDFGTTAALSLSDYDEEYVAKLHKRARRESCYGVCSRILIESVVLEVVASFGRQAMVRFVFEDSHHFESARCAFDDLKQHVPELAPNMGKVIAGAKGEFAGLQAADLVASLGRRSEPTAVFSEVKPGTCRVPRTPNRVPIFHVPIDADWLTGCRLQGLDISGEKRWAKVKAKRAAQASEGPLPDRPRAR